LQLLVATTEFWQQHYLPAREVLQRHGVVPGEGERALTPAQQERGLALVSHLAPRQLPSNSDALKLVHGEVLKRAAATRVTWTGRSDLLAHAAEQ